MVGAVTVFVLTLVVSRCFTEHLTTFAVLALNRPGRASPGKTKRQPLRSGLCAAGPAARARALGADTARVSRETRVSSNSCGRTPLAGRARVGRPWSRCVCVAAAACGAYRRVYLSISGPRRRLAHSENPKRKTKENCRARAPQGDHLSVQPSPKH